MRALLAVYDKSGIEEFARGLVGLGWELVSTGGTFATVQKAGIPVTKVEDITNFPEMLDGRVKTLHPGVHGGILARRSVPEHMAAIAEHNIGPIDTTPMQMGSQLESIRASARAQPYKSSPVFGSGACQSRRPSSG